MTMLELSFSYRDSAELLRGRIQMLREAKRTAEDPDAVRILQARITALTPLWKEARELAVLTANYYKRREVVNGSTL